MFDSYAVILNDRRSKLWLTSYGEVIMKSICSSILWFMGFSFNTYDFHSQVSWSTVVCVVELMFLSLLVVLWDIFSQRAIGACLCVVYQGCVCFDNLFLLQVAGLLVGNWLNLCVLDWVSGCVDFSFFFFKENVNVRNWNNLIFLFLCMFALTKYKLTGIWTCRHRRWHGWGCDVWACPCWTW